MPVQKNMLFKGVCITFCYRERNKKHNLYLEKNNSYDEEGQNKTEQKTDKSLKF